MKRKKILFTCLRMNVGGVEKAMLSLMQALDGFTDSEGRSGRELFDIHLALMAPEGEFMDSIPEYVTLHEIGGFARQQVLWRPPVKGILRQLLTLRWRSGIPAAWHFAKSQLTRSLFPYIKWLLRDDRPGRRFADADLDGEFDLAIDFPGLPGEYLAYYISRHIKARRRASWIHFDLDRVHIRPRSADEAYARMDRIFCVSEKARDQFRSRFPSHAPKARIFHNLINPAEILRLSLLPLPSLSLSPSLSSPVSSSVLPLVPGSSAPGSAKSPLHLVTVGRAMRQKGQDLALRALRALLDEGHRNLFWHFIGGGDQQEEYCAMAASLGVADHCRFYGAVTNPYPFMRMADIYIQPSRYEGYGITIAEAKCFGMPIVATDFVGASEQLSSIPNAIIIPNFKAEDAAEIELLKETIVKGMKLPKITPEPIIGASNELNDFLSLLK